MTAFTSVSTGNWNDPTKWNVGVGYPSKVGDTATIAATHTMTLNTAETCGAITLNATSSGLTISGTGTLTLGGPLTLRGTFLISAGGTFDSNGFAVTRAAATTETFTGTSGSHVTVKSTAGRSYWSTGAFQSIATWDYVDCSGLRDESELGRTHSSAGVMHYDHCTFNDMDNFYIDATGTSVDAGFVFTNNDIRTLRTNGKFLSIWYASQAKGTNPRTFSGNTFDGGGSKIGVVDFHLVKGCTPTNNVFKDWRVQATTAHDNTLDGNLFYSTQNIDQAFFTSSAFLKTNTNNYFYYKGGGHPLSNAAGSFDLTDNILEQGASTGDGTNWLLFGVDGVSVNVKRNICIGAGFGILVTVTGAINFTLLDISNNTFYVDNKHDSAGTPTLFFPPALLTEQSGALTGTVNIYNNIHYDIDLGSTAQDPLVDLLSNTANQVDLLDYNCGWPGACIYTANVVVTAGEDVHGFNVDPQFVDKTRALAVWDSSLGGVGTDVHAITELLKRNGGTWNSAFNISALMAYVRAGFAPQNSALDNTGRGGLDVGAIAVVTGGKALIIYAANSKAIRRIVVSNNDADLQANHVGPGEASLLVPKGQKFNLDDARAAVKAQTGTDPPELLCAVIDQNNKVEHVICADPALDSISIPGKTLVGAYKGVSAKSTYDPITKLYSDPIVTVPAGTLDKNGEPIPSPIVVGGVIPKPAAVSPSLDPVVDSLALGVVTP